MKVLIISGASSGIGQSIAHKFQDQYIVYDFSRSGQSKEKVKHLYCDVSDQELVQSCVNQVLENEGRIDLVISNSGYGIAGAVEDTSLEALQRQFRVNFEGATNLTRASLPALRKTKGRIIYISSVAGAIPIPYQTYYSCTKAALNCLASGLDLETRPLGVRAIAIMPGDLKTDFTAKREMHTEKDSPYFPRFRASLDKMENDERYGESCEIVAKMVYKLSQKKNPKTSYGVGLYYRLVLLLNKVLPIRLRQFIIGKIYG